MSNGSKVSGYTKVSRLQSNEICIPNQKHTKKIEIVYRLTDNRCFAKRLNIKRNKLAEAVERLTNNGMSNRQISDYLNSLGMTSSYGKELSPKIIWSFKKKMGNRYEKLSRTSVRVISGPNVIWAKDL